MIVKRSYFLFCFLLLCFSLSAINENPTSSISSLKALSKSLDYPSFKAHVYENNFTNIYTLRYVSLLEVRYLIRSKKVKKASLLLDSLINTLPFKGDSLSVSQLAYANELKGHVFYNFNNIDSSIFYFDLSSKYYIQNKNYNSAFYNYNMSSTIYYLKGNYSGALFLTYLALDISDEFKVDDNLKVDLYIDLGNIYYSLEKYKKSDSILNYILYSKKTKIDSNQTADIYNNLGMCAFKMLNKNNSLQYFESAESYYLEQNRLYRLSKTYNNLALLHNAFFKDKEKSLTYFRKSIALKKKLNQKKALALSYLNISSIYMEMNNLDSSLFYSLLAQNNYDPKSIEMASVYSQLSKIYSEKEDYKNAYLYSKKLNYLLENNKRETEQRALVTAKEEYSLRMHKARLKILEKNKELDETKINRNRTLIFLLSISFIFLLIVFIKYVGVVKNKQKVAALLHKKGLALNSISSLVKGQEQERNRIASDLHDGVGNTIALLNLKAQSLKNDDLIDLTHQISQEVREISHNIMPGILFKLGLKEALMELSEKWKKLNVIVDVTYKLKDNIYTDQDKQLFLYRVIQELTNNSVNHGKSNYISIHFENEVQGIKVSFEDNGSGFNNKETKNGQGLNNIENRIAFLGGDLNIVSSASGSSFYIKLPKT